MAQTLPDTIGNFKIVSEIGRGGMGTVYHAIQGTLQRPVALKILPPEFSTDSEHVTRFLREARTIAALSHENVVQIYDAGEQSGRYYIAMELVEGVNLLAYLEQKGKIAESEGVDLLLQAANGLAAAHAKGLVHRDIKPENMLLGKDGKLRIVDFGLVMESTSTTQLTATGARLGTPMYMSPEQADGEVADARTDVYSLGVSFFRVLTGQPPFTSTTVMNLLYKHKFEAPPDPRSIRPELSENVANLLLQMMAKHRPDRPQNGQELAARIQSMKSGVPIPPALTTAAPSLPAATPSAAVSTGSSTIIRDEPRDAKLFSKSAKTILGIAGLVAAVLLVWLFSSPNVREQQLTGEPPQVKTAIQRIDDLVKSGRHDEAALEMLRTVDAHPQSKGVASYKTAFDAYLAVARLCDRGIKTCESAALKATETFELERHKTLETFKTDFNGFQQKFKQAAESAKTDFHERRQEALIEARSAARLDALALAKKLDSAATDCRRLSDEASEKNKIGGEIPIINRRIEFMRESKTSEVYRKAGDAFKHLASELRSHAK